MNDWIRDYIAAFWLACLGVGALSGYVALGAPYGPLAGLVGGAGAALILSISRYISGDDVEDEGPPR